MIRWQEELRITRDDLDEGRWVPFTVCPKYFLVIPQHVVYIVPALKNPLIEENLLSPALERIV